jgi:hypothetical protein
MSIQLWIGVGFLVALIIFVMVAFFAAPKLTSDQRKAIKFLAALCAGVSGGFISGASVFDASWTTPTSTVALSGTAGFALFFVVFFFYDRIFAPDDGLDFDIPSGATFKTASDAAAKLAGVNVDYQDLSSTELSEQLSEGHIKCDTFDQLLRILQIKTVTPGAIRKFNVTEANNIYRIVV